VATVTDSTPWIHALRTSHDTLAGLVGGLDGDGLRQQSYAKEWTIADVLSHLGSGAEISQLSLTAGLTGGQPPSAGDFQPVWDKWNARTPEEQAAQSVVVNEALVSRVESLTAAERERFSVSMFGAMTLDFPGYLAMRLGEHALHTWDIAVTLDPARRLAPDAVALLVDTLPGMSGFLGKRAPAPVKIAVTTSGPERALILDTGGVSIAPAGGGDGATASLALSAEAFVRLIAGRVDGPEGITASGVTLPELQAVFPGF
jgi:uncharacterized protein (TIGR03083 family)